MRNLKRAGMTRADLKRVYETILRPVLDFASATYHPLLNVNLTAELEALQKRAAKIIYGVHRSYSDVIESGDLELLETRRHRLCINFAKKSAANPKFATRWFPLKAQSTYNTRRPDLYIEEKPKTERFKHNLVTFMRSQLNTLNKL